MSNMGHGRRRSMVMIGIGLIVLLVVVLLLVLGGFGSAITSYFNKGTSYSAQELGTKGEEQLKKGDLESAERYLEQALLQQDDPTYRNNLAVVKYRLKKYDESITHYRKIIESKHDLSFAYNGIGNAYRDLGDSTAAEEAYKQSIAANSHYVAAYSNLALLLFNTGNTSEALKQLDTGITVTNDSSLKSIRTILAKQAS